MSDDLQLVPFDDSGIDLRNADHLAYIDGWADVEEFVHERLDKFAWVHPRFQWLTTEDR